MEDVKPKTKPQLNYTFEDDYDDSVEISDQHGTNKKVFCEHLGFSEDAKFSREEKITIDAFFRDNLYNIIWYRKRIRKENFAVSLYFGFTLCVLLGVPALIFNATLSSWSDEIGIANLNNAEKIGSGITVMLSSLLALHKFTSTWIDRRKFSAQFHQAGVELKDILYELQGNYFGRAANGERGFASRNDKRYFADDFFRALKNATKLSKAVVDAETRAYFEKRANPSFDIAGIWRSSANTAREAFGAFKASTWNIEELREKVNAGEHSVLLNNSEIADKEQKKQIAQMKLQRLARQEETLSLQLDELEARKSQHTAADINRLDQLKSRFDKLQDEIDEAELAIRVLEVEMAGLKVSGEK